MIFPSSESDPRPVFSSGRSGQTARRSGVAVLAGALSLIVLAGCTASRREAMPGSLGTPVSLTAVEASLSLPGPIRFQRVVAADWEIALSGLLNLDHPRAQAAGLEDGLEAIQVYFYVLEHPEFGDYLVDSGVASGFRAEGGHPDVSALVEAAMNTQSLEIHRTTGEWLAERSRPLAGVFLTHSHLDHVMGLPDVPASVPVYVGPGELDARQFLHLFTRGTIDRMLGESSELRVWPFAESAGAGNPPILDVFGDGSLWAFHVPGHTPGSTAFLARTSEGPRLMIGDASHTRWGWMNDVEPGTFTADHAQNAESLSWLRSLAARHPAIEVHLGHQRLDSE